MFQWPGGVEEPGAGGIFATGCSTEPFHLGARLPTVFCTGFPPCEVSLGYQPPLFPSEVSVPSVQQHIRKCRKTWHDARAALLRTAETNILLADCCSVPPPQLVYQDSPCGSPLKTSSSSSFFHQKGRQYFCHGAHPTALHQDSHCLSCFLPPPP